MKNSFPDWVLQHKQTGTEVRYLKGRYYLYKVSSKWDATLKRSKKITEAYLGSITPEGFKPKRINTSLTDQRVRVCNFGAIHYLQSRNKDLLTVLKKLFPHRWSSLFLCAVFRLLYQSPLKKMGFYFQNSYGIELFTQARMNPKTLSDYLAYVGQRRGSVCHFFEQFQKGSQFVLIDGTDLPTASKTNELAAVGYNHKSTFKPQVNALFIFAQDEKMPLYYRLTGGDIREITSMKLAVDESGLQQVVIVSDKGFYSKANIENLLQEKLHFAIPLKRNNKLIDYRLLKSANKQKFKGFFLYQKRPIWYTQQRININNRYCQLYLFLDEQLYQEEQKDYLLRIEKGRVGYTLANFYEKQHRFGTLALMTYLPKKTGAQKAFGHFKTRNEVEQMIDVFKNILQADRSYMRDKQHLEGWMFVSHIAIMLYYRIYKELLNYGMLNKYAPVEILEYLDRIHKIKINDKWTIAEIPKTTQKILQKIKLPIT